MGRRTSPLPRRYMEAQSRFPRVLEAYEQFGKALESAGPLNKREQRLVKLGLAFGAKLEGASHSAVRKGMDVGLAPRELEHAALLAMTTLGFAHGMTCLCWVQDVTQKSVSVKGKRARGH
ncbi:MAG: carboxymuconolactone decarboxylase family protein [Planctomycetes bacterium]|nr:carboxymuconolactone decarboxylase family protein [Planctomycetota bacterium]